MTGLYVKLYLRNGTSRKAGPRLALTPTRVGSEAT
jgi:hypothetical protein